MNCDGSACVIAGVVSNGLGLLSTPHGEHNGILTQNDEHSSNSYIVNAVMPNER